MTTAIRTTPSDQVDRGLLALRIVAGAIFAAHGWQKLVTYGITGVTGGFTAMGIPLPGIVGPAIGALELLGGTALILGLFGRLVPALLAFDMLGAIVFVEFRKGFFMPNGYEFVLSLLGASIALALSGPGRFSASAVLARRR